MRGLLPVTLGDLERLKVVSPF